MLPPSRDDAVQLRALLSGQGEGHGGGGVSDRLGPARAGDRQDVVAEDRKSTRLNSSHVKISYAVVCLKKKTEGGSGLRRGAKPQYNAQTAGAIVENHA